jgi:SAM-dependent methyltransferase
MNSTNVVSLQSADGYGYRDLAHHPATAAARVVVKLLRERLSFSSVLDVGCGVGLWLNEYRTQGIEDVFGLDGPWVPQENLAIPRDRFRTHDLTQRFQLGRRFDLVMCLEVAEHLPAESADTLLDSLAAHGDLILFSAAIPGQGGFQHVNEQLQDYWIERFRRRGFTAYDVIRPVVWNHPEVPYYYAQNALVFSRKPLPFPTEFIPSPIHPEIFLRRNDPKNYSLRAILKNFPFYLRRFFRAGKTSTSADE